MQRIFKVWDGISRFGVKVVGLGKDGCSVGMDRKQCYNICSIANYYNEHSDFRMLDLSKVLSIFWTEQIFCNDKILQRAGVKRKRT